MTNQDCKLYAENIFSKTSFKDPSIEKLSKKYLLKLANNNKYKPKTKYNKMNGLRRLIDKYISGIKISDLNSNWFLNNIQNKLKKYQFNPFIRFIIFILENHVVEDKELYKLLYLKERFSTRIIKEEIIYFINCNNLEQYKKLGFFNSKDGYSAFFIILEKNKFKDLSMYSYVNDFFNYYKLNSAKSFSSLSNELWSINKKLIENNLVNITLSNFNKNIIIKYLTDNKGRLLYPLFLTKMIKFGLENDYFKNEQFHDIKHITNYLNNSLTNKILKNILTENEPDKFQFISAPNRNVLFYINTDSKVIKQILINFLSKFNTSLYTQTKYFVSSFKESYGDYKIKEISDINYSIFKKQVDFYKKNEEDCISILVNFYLFIFKYYNKELFRETKKFNIDVLQRYFIAKELIEGYKFVSYNTYETYPSHDKWILYYGGLEGSNLSLNKNSSKTINFKNIKHPKYRDWAKYYIWYHDSALYTKISALGHFKHFSNYIYNIKSGKEPSFFSPKNSDYSIKISDIIAYKKKIISTQDNHITISRYIYNIRSILLFLNSNNIINIDKGAIYHLTYSTYHSPTSAESISNKDLEDISQLMKKKAQKDIVHALYYGIFYILLETEFRISQILSLEKDCIHETYKSGQFVLKSTTKRSPKYKQEQPITTYVKRQIDEIIKLTNTYREKCQRNKIKNYLFIVPGARTDMFKIITNANFNKYLKECCNKLDIKEYTAGNLRDTHMTKSEEYIIRNSLSDLEMNTLTGHKSIDTTNKHYIDTDITELLESVHGIIIGNVSVEGRILKKLPNEIQTTDKVSNQCGYCSANVCEDFTYLDCMLCHSFVTCVDRIPYFKEQIKMIDYKIKNTNNLHDVEDLRSIKILLATYLKKLLLLKGAFNYE